MGCEVAGLGEPCPGCEVVRTSFQNCDVMCHECLKQISKSPPPNWIPTEKLSLTTTEKLRIPDRKPHRGPEAHKTLEDWMQEAETIEQEEGPNLQAQIAKLGAQAAGAQGFANLMTSLKC